MNNLQLDKFVSEEDVLSAIKEIFSENKEVWLYALNKVVSEKNTPQPTIISDMIKIQDSDWVVISSLSQLRREVGGRFNLIKDRWVEAGFPLKANRGEEKGDYVLQEEGWVKMSSWLIEQGYGVQLLSADDSRGYFEVKKTIEKS